MKDPCSVLLFLVCLVCFSAALDYKPDCMVSSNRQIPDETTLNNGGDSRWTWRHVLITAWFDQEEALHHPLLDITLKFEDFHIAVERTDIMINNGRTSAIAKVQGSPETSNITVKFNPLPTGWQDFTLSITSVFTVTSKTLQGNSKILQVPLTKTLEYIKIKGSNLTLQCQDSFPVWRVKDGATVTVPLNRNEPSHSFAVYAMEGSRPSFTIGDKTFRLGWSSDGRMTSVAVEDSLPPHVHHNFTITCHDPSPTVRCSITDDSSTDGSELDTIIIAERPNHLSVESDDENTFYLTLYNRLHPKEK
ncbi:unnamed protein product, partial [Meganyctiphanes norvegica]